ncbi:MAG TPA: divalent-cation tolerance protein CutA [Candidatus Omnitrophota bacterium]|nr:divalent-cation tolerance protein CutA [Candidatus Omnitrophota bacterium]HPW77182.1 divalent-cation tolerance protein CutA [Candidatus Omnitrophota bacterium]HQB11965.1 divalent-cation tolerance protein CutA [Candidatus Omnitrophota bacterium]
MKYCCIVSAVPNIKEARRLAGLLLASKIAACVQILPGMESHYCWKGKRERSREVLLLIKTRASLYAKVEKTILKYHSYEVPEIICFPIEKGSPSFLKWVAENARV